MDTAPTIPYYAVYAFAVPIAITLAIFFWKPFFSDERNKPTRDKLFLMVIVSLLGSSWLASAGFEGRYLDRLVGAYLPNQFHNQLISALVIFGIWALLIAVSAKGSLLLYCSFYFLYTLLASFSSNNVANPTIVKALTLGIDGGAITTEKANLIIKFYEGRHWDFIAVESITLAFFAALLAFVSRKKELNFWKDLWKSPQLILLIELIVSQGVLWFYRFQMYNIT